jgi:hypothetical protein
VAGGSAGSFVAGEVAASAVGCAGDAELAASTEPDVVGPHGWDPHAAKLTSAFAHVALPGRRASPVW